MHNTHSDGIPASPAAPIRTCKATRGRKRRHLGRACESCHARKIRCNETGQIPCSHCSSSGVQCSSTSLSKTTLRQVAESLDGAGGHDPSSEPQHQHLHRHLFPESGNPSVVGTGAQEEPDFTADDAIWARNLHWMSDDALTDAGSSVTAMSPQDSTSTQNGSTTARKRLKFAGETLAEPALLPLMNGHAELSARRGSPTSEHVDRSELRQFATPTSGHPHGRAPWVNADCQAHMDLLWHLQPEDRYYLYNMKKIFKFPQRSVTAELIRVFFVAVYPLQPIVNRRDIEEEYKKLYSHQPSSPMLFHAMLFCASQFADDHVLQEAGFRNGKEAKLYFFQRAKILYSYDCEPDQLKVVQSLILLSFWWMDWTEEKDMRYWLSCAINLASSMGMHKEVPRSLNMSITSCHLWRRIFWVLFARDHNVAIALGQPFIIRLANCDLPMICESDFDEPYHSGLLALPRQTRCQVHVGLKYIELSVQMEKLLLSLQDTHDNCEILQILWERKDFVSPDNLALPTDAADTISADDPSTWDISNVWVIFLHLYHERAVMLYHRRREKALLEIQRSSQEVDPPALDGSSQDLDEVRTDITSSATRVMSLLDGLRVARLIRYAPSFVNTTTFHALLSLVEDIATHDDNTNRHQLAKIHFKAGLEALAAMRKSWSAASWSFGLFSAFARNNFQPLKAPALRRKGGEEEGERELTFDCPWDTEFLGTFQFMGEGAPFSTDMFHNWQDQTEGSDPLFSLF